MANYTGDYFGSGIFDFDYSPIADAVVDIYSPRSVIDVGCGPGKLSRALANLGVRVTAIDAFADAEIGQQVDFTRVDLNDASAVREFFSRGQYDLAVCLEVAEHLIPAAADTLISCLTQVSPIVIFSAAVPEQGGHGHINLHPRQYWHQHFTRNRFICADRIRERVRDNEQVAPWYRLNAIDYVRMDHPARPSEDEVIARLVASESAAASAYYSLSGRLTAAENRLRYGPVQAYLWLRRAVKSLIHG